VIEHCDAVVIGAGHNGLVAAARLADAGWDVLVVEASESAGGAVRSAEVMAPGVVTDLFSAFYPMTAASPVIRSLGLEDHGLEWVHAPKVLAHLRPDAPSAVLYRDAHRTAERLDAFEPGDGRPWLELDEQWGRFGEPMLRALLSPFPPVRAAVGLARSAGPDLWDLVRMTVMPVRTMTAELFDGSMAPLLLAGNALHADVTPESAPSAFLGWLLVGLGQTVGFPVPKGGAGRLSEALVGRMAASGGSLQLGCPVEAIDVRNGRAVGVQTRNGYVGARRAVLAACDAQILYGRLLDDHHLPPAFLARMRTFHRAGGTVKVNYTLSSPAPWSDEDVHGAGTVHLADSMQELSTSASELESGRLPSNPFLLIGQMTTSDPSRSPAGTESMWAYTHVPQSIRGDAAGVIDCTGRLRGEALGQFVERMEDRIEAHAPGFRSRIAHRHVQGPDDLEAANPSLVGGDISGGTAQLHQQIVFRPVPGLARPETPVRGLYLASSSAHPGGSVHGACGANAAGAALLHHRARAGARIAGLGLAAAVPGAAMAARRRGRR
jgi:phytoene dehydrogenase-like protein